MSFTAKIGLDTSDYVSGIRVAIGALQGLTKETERADQTQRRLTAATGMRPEVVANYKAMANQLSETTSMLQRFTRDYAHLQEISDRLTVGKNFIKSLEKLGVAKEELKAVRAELKATAQAAAEMFSDADVQKQLGYTAFLDRAKRASVDLRQSYVDLSTKYKEYLGNMDLEADLRSKINSLMVEEKTLQRRGLKESNPEEQEFLRKTLTLVGTRAEENLASLGERLYNHALRAGQDTARGLAKGIASELNGSTMIEDELKTKIEKARMMLGRAFNNNISTNPQAFIDDMNSGDPALRAHAEVTNPEIAAAYQHLKQLEQELRGEQWKTAELIGKKKDEEYSKEMARRQEEKQQLVASFNEEIRLHHAEADLKEWLHQQEMDRRAEENAAFAQSKINAANRQTLADAKADAKELYRVSGRKAEFLAANSSGMEVIIPDISRVQPVRYQPQDQLAILNAEERVAEAFAQTTHEMSDYKTIQRHILTGDAEMIQQNRELANSVLALAAAEKNADRALLDAHRNGGPNKTESQLTYERFAELRTSPFGRQFIADNTASATSTGMKSDLILHSNNVLQALAKANVPLKEIPHTLKAIRSGSVDVISTLPNVTRELLSLDRAANQVDSTGEKLTLNFKNLSRLVFARVITFGFYGMTQQLSQAVREATDLSKRLGEIQTLSQDMPQSTAKWAADIRGVSDKYNFKQSDTAGAFYETLSNQVAQGADVAPFNEEIAQFAKITRSSLTDSMNLASSAINAFQLDAKDTHQILAELFKTIDLGRVTASDMANTFGRVSAMTELANIPMSDMLALIQKLTISGMSFDSASTGVINMLNKIIKPTDAFKAQMKSWGANNSDEALRMYGLKGILQKMFNENQGSLADLGLKANDLRAMRGFATVFNAGVDSLEDNAKRTLEAGEDYDKGIRKFYENNPGEQVSAELNKIQNQLQAASMEMLRNVAAIDNWIGAVGRLTGLSQDAGIASLTSWMGELAIPLAGVAGAQVAGGMLGFSRKDYLRAKREKENVFNATNFEVSKLVDSDLSRSNIVSDASIKRMTREQFKQMQEIYPEEALGGMERFDRLAESNVKSVGRMTGALKSFGGVAKTALVYLPELLAAGYIAYQLTGRVLGSWNTWQEGTETRTEKQIKSIREMNALLEKQKQILDERTRRDISSLTKSQATALDAYDAKIIEANYAFKEQEKLILRIADAWKDVNGQLKDYLTDFQKTQREAGFREAGFMNPGGEIQAKQSYLGEQADRLQGLLANPDADPRDITAQAKDTLTTIQDIRKSYLETGAVIREALQLRDRGNELRNQNMVDQGAEKIKGLGFDPTGQNLDGLPNWDDGLASQLYSNYQEFESGAQQIVDSLANFAGHDLSTITSPQEAIDATTVMNRMYEEESEDRKLVYDIIKKGIDKGSTFIEIRDELKKLPEALQGLVADFVNSGFGLEAIDAAKAKKDALAGVQKDQVKEKAAGLEGKFLPSLFQKDYNEAIEAARAARNKQSPFLVPTGNNLIDIVKEETAKSQGILTPQQEALNLRAKQSEQLALADSYQARIAEDMAANGGVSTLLQKDSPFLVEVEKTLGELQATTNALTQIALKNQRDQSAGLIGGAMDYFTDDQNIPGITGGEAGTKLTNLRRNLRGYSKEGFAGTTAGAEALSEEELKLLKIQGTDLPPASNPLQYFIDNKYSEKLTTDNTPELAKQAADYLLSIANEEARTGTMNEDLKAAGFNSFADQEALYNKLLTRANPEESIAALAQQYAPDPDAIQKVEIVNLEIASPVSQQQQIVDAFNASIEGPEYTKHGLSDWRASQVTPEEREARIQEMYDKRRQPVRPLTLEEKEARLQALYDSGQIKTEYAKGGAVRGTGGTDTIPAWLTNGEFVVNAKATEKFFPFLNAINAQRFEDGGLVSPNALNLMWSGPGSRNNGGGMSIRNDYRNNYNIHLNGVADPELNAQRIMGAIKREEHRRRVTF